MSGGGSLGVAVTGSKSHSSLAKAFQPGPKPYLKSGMPWIVFGGILVALTVLELPTFWGSYDVLIVLLQAGLGIGFILRGKSASIKHRQAFEEEMPAWEARQQMLERGWLCHRCGQSWLP